MEIAAIGLICFILGLAIGSSLRCDADAEEAWEAQSAAYSRGCNDCRCKRAL